MLNGGMVANEWQPMSALIWVGPSSRCTSLRALNTGRSGQPVQKAGGRAGRSPKPAAALGRWPTMSRTLATIASVSMPAGRTSARKAASPSSSTSAVYSPALGSGPLPSTRVCDVGAAQLHVHRLLDVFGMAFLDHEHGALAGAEAAQLLGHQRIDHVEHQERHPRGAEDVGEAEPLQRAQQAVGEAAHDDDADLVEIAGDHLVELVVADEGLRRRHPASRP